MIVRTIHCGQCGKHLPQGNVHSSVIGPPFTVCPGCQTINLSRTRSEWDHKTPAERTLHLLKAAGYVTLMGGLMGMGLPILFGRFTGAKVSTMAWAIGGGAGIVLGQLWSWYRFRAAVADSKDRLADPAYLAELKRLAATK